ncbi:cytochrome P450 [Vararia minispora EC-137]|uniref:Cytochrome P450 n=1 Tax=Vararia minispora EC-137 TaxID=1314806 RepID=A0ACB8QDL2_9AGAM|nr:cytochrome P450 [Vararia minispora EC-137]
MLGQVFGCATWPRIAAVAGLWVSYKLYRRFTHVCALSFLPGPPTLSYVWGNVSALRKAPVGTRYNVWRKMYGPVYRLREPLMEPILILGDPKGALYVLNKTTTYWRPAIDRVVLRLWFGPSILSSETHEHLQRKRRMSPAFTTQSVKTISATLLDLAHDLVNEWDGKLGPDESMVIDMAKDLHRLSLNGISRTMFAYDLSDPTGRIPTLLNKFSSGPGDEDTTLKRLASLVISANPLLMNLPNPFKEWADMLRTELGTIAQKVWGAVEKGESLEGLDARVLEVLSQQQKKGERISKDDAVAEIVGLLFAGSESTGNCIRQELIYELAHKPHIQTKMRDELRAFEAHNGSPPGYGDLMISGGNSLDYFNAVVMETLRTKAVLMDIAREAVANDVIPLNIPLPGSAAHSLPVRKGQIIYIPIRDGLNVDPDIWGDDAETFRPERWLDPGAHERGVGPGGIVTFGDGAKTCLGRVFAIAEIKIVAAILVRTFSFHPSDDHFDIDFYHLRGNTVKPKVRGHENEGVQMPLRIRRA